THQYGVAMDLTHGSGSQAEQAQLARLLQPHGWHWAGEPDPVHFTYTGAGVGDPPLSLLDVPLPRPRANRDQGSAVRGQGPAPAAAPPPPSFSRLAAAAPHPAELALHQADEALDRLPPSMHQPGYRAAPGGPVARGRLTQEIAQRDMARTLPQLVRQYQEQEAE